MRFGITWPTVYNEIENIFEYSHFRFSINATSLIFIKTHFSEEVWCSSEQSNPSQWLFQWIWPLRQMLQYFLQADRGSSETVSMSAFQNYRLRSPCLLWLPLLVFLLDQRDGILKRVPMRCEYVEWCL